MQSAHHSYRTWARPWLHESTIPVATPRCLESGHAMPGYCWPHARSDGITQLFRRNSCVFTPSDYHDLGEMFRGLHHLPA